MVVPLVKSGIFPWSAIAFSFSSQRLMASIFFTSPSLQGRKQKRHKESAFEDSLRCFPTLFPQADIMALLSVIEISQVRRDQRGSLQTQFPTEEHCIEEMLISSNHTQIHAVPLISPLCCWSSTSCLLALWLRINTLFSLISVECGQKFHGLAQPYIICTYPELFIKLLCQDQWTKPHKPTTV